MRVCEEQIQWEIGMGTESWEWDEGITVCQIVFPHISIVRTWRAIYYCTLPRAQTSDLPLPRWHRRTITPPPCLAM